ncbi:hypothetical protein JCGZ_08721 [Jatropha curcas]|uniref:Uncharacterized protein n=1 Tax=Jatropha curcas TaxID=180498 RepID=A0A067KIX0_JATCU|nr:hypothetical protein JCGZ_08721 [Jatropha curcas]
MLCRLHFNNVNGFKEWLKQKTMELKSPKNNNIIYKGAIKDELKRTAFVSEGAINDELENSIGLHLQKVFSISTQTKVGAGLDMVIRNSNGKVMAAGVRKVLLMVTLQEAKNLHLIKIPVACSLFYKKNCLLSIQRATPTETSFEPDMHEVLAAITVFLKLLPKATRCISHPTYF